jgi:hypothetical protein
MSEPISAVRARLQGAAAPPVTEPVARRGLITRLFDKAPTWVRRHERFPCCVIALLNLDDRDLALDGLVTEISQGGVLFRPASHFILDRRGAKVTVRFAEDEIAGSIVNVKTHGYGIEFDETITAERARDILDRFGLTGHQAVQ